MLGPGALRKWTPDTHEASLGLGQISFLLGPPGPHLQVSGRISVSGRSGRPGGEAEPRAAWFLADSMFSLPGRWQNVGFEESSGTRRE